MNIHNGADERVQSAVLALFARAALLVIVVLAGGIALVRWLFT